MIRIKTAHMLALGALLVLGACSRQPEPQAPLNEGVDAGATDLSQDNQAVEAAAAPAANAAPENVQKPVANQTADGVSTTPDEQIRDDADAAGMTARLPDSADSAPVEKTETK